MELMTSVPSQITILLVQVHCTRRIEASIASTDTLTSILAELECFFNDLQQIFVSGRHSTEYLVLFQFVFVCVLC